MARLYPAVKPYTVLETTAGFYKMHGAAGALVGVICFLLRLSAWQIAAITLAVTVAAYFMAVYATYPPGLLRIARSYSLLTGYGIVLLALSIVGWLTVGFVAMAAFWVARLLAEAVTLAHARHLGRRLSLALLRDEPASVREHARWASLVPDGFALRCFGNAYATYAQKHGAPIDLVATENELESHKWREVLKVFTDEWPEVARRFDLESSAWRVP